MTKDFKKKFQKIELKMIFSPIRFQESIESIEYESKFTSI